MASPQIDDGKYTRIANEILSAMARSNFSSAEFMILLAVISKTYGWNKTKDQISIGQFETLTKMSRRAICKNTLSLVNKNVLGRESRGGSALQGTSAPQGTTPPSDEYNTIHVTTYWIQKDYEKWIVNKTTSEGGGSALGGTSAFSGMGVVPPRAPTKDTTTKDSKYIMIKKMLEQQTKAFEVSWGKYPRKIGKTKAFKVYCKTVITGLLAKQCDRAVENYLQEIEDKGTDEKYIKHGSTFFGQWQDYYELKPFEEGEDGYVPTEVDI